VIREVHFQVMTSVLTWALVAGVAGWLIGFPVYRLLSRFGLLDNPNARSSHTESTVRGGGLGNVMIVLILGGAAGLHQPSVLSVAWLLLLLGLSVVSFWDDLSTLSWKVRFGTHALVSAGFLYGLVRQGGFEGLSVPMASGLGIVLFLFLAGYANAFNFMDGINGIAASQAVVTGLGTIAVAHVVGVPFAHPALVLAAIIAGAAAGFLPHNFPYARMFMGDVGSVPLGFGLAAVAVWIAADHGWWLLVLLGGLHANFILDTAITFVRRILRGEVFHQAHREHFYQRLVRAGWSHSAVTGCEMGLQVLALGVVLIGVTRGRWSMVWIVPAVSMIWLAFFGFCEREFRRHQADLDINQG
jgi:UDP-N-acetylmuramyl pentapeptide phosphotransferase/UDP-N-acetylglucosamine-1-phosphate transferase